jgi:3-oxoacyl-[acyl-carrier-protein] synthase II
MRNKNNIVITGIGPITAIGEGKEKFWNGLQAQKSGIRPITLFDTSIYDFDQAGEITDFNPKHYLGKKGLRYWNRTTRLLMAATYLCLQDAGIKNSDREYLSYSPDQLGISLGTTWGIFHSISVFDREALTEGPQYVSPSEFANTVINAPAGYLSIKEDIRGFNVTMSTGYNASLDAIGLACNYLNNNRVECIVAGGAEEFCEEFFLTYSKKKIPLSETSFPSEGSVMFSLERQSDAQQRNAHIYGEIIGYSNTFSKNSEGLAMAIKQAIKNADIEESGIDLIMKVTNLSPQEKNTEQEALQKVFSTDITQTDISPITGDSYSAGGSMQVGACLNFINKGEANTVLCTSLDQGGNNSALIITRCP